MGIKQDWDAIESISGELRKLGKAVETAKVYASQQHVEESQFGNVEQASGLAAKGASEAIKTVETALGRAAGYLESFVEQAKKAVDGQRENEQAATDRSRNTERAMS